MKLLYICHGLQNSGWGRAARENILALDTAGVDVVWRNIALNDDSYVPEGRLTELYEKDIDGSEYCVQHVLPNLLSYNSAFKKNIAYFVAETLDWNASSFHHYINMMDECWFPNTEMANNAKKFIKIPIHVVPHSTDTEKYNKIYDKINIPDLQSGYTFYTIAEWNKRKRLGLLVQAFTLEFKKTEPVNLVVKTHKHGIKPNKLGAEVQDFCQKIKSATKLYKRPEFYPNEIIISSFMNEEEIMQLHESCNCFVNTSYGEAWSYPAFDAMAMGNSVISPMIGGPSDFLEDYDYCYPLDGQYKPVFGMDQENFSNYNSSRESWFEADLNHLREQMRMAYEDNAVKKRINGKHIVKQHSRENIGKLMKGLL